MRVLLLGSVLAFVSSGVMVAWADEPVSNASAKVEPAAAQTSVKVYPVGDLIELAKPTTPGGSSPYPPAAQPAFYAAPAPSGSLPDPSPIGRLAEVVRAMSSAEVISHADTMSLVVRDTETGHRKVQELLDGLHKAATPAIQVEFRRMFIGGVSDDDLTEEQIKQLTVMLSQTHLSPADVAMLREIDTDLQQTRNVPLLPGREATWGDATHRGQVIAKASFDRKSIQMRLDYESQEGSDDIPCHSHTYRIPNAHSILIHQHVKGDLAIWLITPSFIEDEEEADAENSQLSKIPYSKKLFRNVGTVNGVEVGVPIE